MTSIRRTVRVVLTVAALLAAGGAATAQPVQPPPADRVLVVGTKEAPPFAMKGEDGDWRGISIDLWRRVAEQLHLRYELKETNLDGLIEGTAAGTIDVAVAALTITAERDRILDFAQPFYDSGLGIAVPKNVTFNWFRLVRSLVSVGFAEALLGLIGVTLLIGAVVWLIERRHTEHFGPGRHGLVSSVWWSALTMTQAGPEQTPMTPIGRFVAVAWMGASVMVIAVFTAGLTSQLTAKQLQGIVHEVDDLRSVRVGAVGGTASLAYLTHQRIAYRTFATAQDGMAALKAGTLDALVYDRPLLAWLAKQSFGGVVEVLDVTFDRQGYAFALPNDSTLRVPVDRAMLALIETDWWRDTTAKYLGKE